MEKDWFDTLRNAEVKPRKKLVKQGTLITDTVETTPVVWNDTLLIFMWVRSKEVTPYTLGAPEHSHYTFWNPKTDEYTEPFAEDYCFGCCYEENGVMYVVGGKGLFGSYDLDIMSSEDLIHWKTKKILTLPEGITAYNTSLCKGENGYALAVEIGGDSPIVGKPYTCVFAFSKDLENFEFFPMDTYVHTTERYSACPALRYADGCYYMIYLEEMPCYRSVPYIVRTKDFKTFEQALHNPVMFFGDEDRKVIYPERLSKEALKRIATASNNNNSDVDLCEYHGKTYITYAWGNQLGKEMLAYAIYDGKITEFLQSFFA